MAIVDFEQLRFDNYANADWARKGLLVGQLPAWALEELSGPVSVFSMETKALLRAELRRRAELEA